MAVSINKEKCTGCGDCVDTCPVEALSIKNEKAVVNDECIDCGACVDTCPNNAISLQECFLEVHPAGAEEGEIVPVRVREAIASAQSAA